MEEQTIPVPAPSPVPAPVGAVVPAEGGYNEMFCYSSVVRPNYVPGYTPHASSLFENPREYPAQLCVMATPYHLYANLPGWFFGSPNGYQSSVPPDSHAYLYNSGQLGITSKLVNGYPEGLRVVERVIVPYGQYCRQGGFFISAGAQKVQTAVQVEQKTETTEKTNKTVATEQRPIAGQQLEKSRSAAPVSARPTPLNPPSK